MGKKLRIVWTAAERSQVVHRAVSILRGYPRMPVFRAVGEAQTAVLPPERQRAIINKATLGDLSDEIEQQLNSLVEHRVDTNKYETVTAPLVSSEDAVAAAARQVAQRFEAELRAALANTTARIVQQAAEGKL